MCLEGSDQILARGSIHWNADIEFIRILETEVVTKIQLSVFVALHSLSALSGIIALLLSRPSFLCSGIFLEEPI